MSSINLQVSKQVSKIAAIAMIALAGACTHQQKERIYGRAQEEVPQERISDAVVVPILVKVTEDKTQASGFAFEYFGPFTDKNGNINLTGKIPAFSNDFEARASEYQLLDKFSPETIAALEETKIQTKIVKLKFELLSDLSVPGLKFQQGRQAMYIVEKRLLADESGSPTAPYDGREFFDFRTGCDCENKNRNATTFSVIDLNNDGETYRYALRFDLNGKPVVHDPDTENGGHPH